MAQSAHTQDPRPASSPFERMNDALRGLDDQIHDLREQFEDRRRDLEEDLRRRAEDVQSQIKRSTLFKRAERTRKDLEDRAEELRDGLFNALGLATKADVVKLQKKLNSVSRKLNELAKHAREADERLVL